MKRPPKRSMVPPGYRAAYCRPHYARERYTTEVIVDRFRGELVLLDSRNSGDGSDRTPTPQQRPQSNSYAQKDNGWSNPSDLDDEIPF